MNELPEPESPPITFSVSEGEAAQIMEEMGLVSIGRPNPGERSGFASLAHLRALGSFIEHTAGVRIDRGSVLVAEKVAVDHLLRLNDKAKQEGLSLEELKALTYPIGYLIQQLAKMASLGIRSKTILEAAKEVNVPRRASWTPGQSINPPTLEVVAK